MALVSSGISAVFVVAILLSKPCRRVLLWRVYCAVLLGLLLWFIPSFMRAGDDVFDISVMVGASLLIFGLTLWRITPRL